VVTKINIKEKVVPKSVAVEEEESEEEESSEEEEEPKKEEPEEEKKCKLLAIFHSSIEFSNRGRTRKEIDEGREKTKRQRLEGKAEAKEVGIEEKGTGRVRSSNGQCSRRKQTRRSQR